MVDVKIAQADYLVRTRKTVISFQNVRGSVVYGAGPAEIKCQS